MSGDFDLGSAKREPRKLGLGVLKSQRDPKTGRMLPTGKRTPEYRREYTRKYRALVGRKDDSGNGQPRSKRDPVKLRARTALNHAVERGKLERPTTCPGCGAKDVPSRRMHGHHADYAKPLEVEWLCSKCHGKLRYAS